MPTLAGFGVANYRSVFGASQMLAPLQSVNLLAGQNNTGKSNMLRVAHQLLGACSGAGYQTTVTGLTDLDIPSGLAQGGQLQLLVGISTEDDLPSKLFGANEAKLDGGGQVGVKAVFNTSAFRLTDDPIYWFRFEIEPQQKNMNLTPSVAQLQKAMAELDHTQRQYVSNASSGITNQSGGEMHHDLERLVKEAAPLRYVPPVRTIVAFRQITLLQGNLPGDDSDATPEDVGSGAAIVKYLLRLQNPDHSKIGDKAKFAAMNDFLKTVLEDPSAELSIPYHGRTIHVVHHGRSLPLESVGTGIHEVVILAAAAMMTRDNLVCIEEPEIHLHPLLQRKFLSFLAKNTSNQYLIATHSAHMLDSEIGSIFHATMHDEEGTHIRLAARPADQAAISMDLGYRPSDLVQTNAIIWVEGPSDRIYLRHWISLVDSSLKEGSHYSLMFYGGGLLNHLSGEDPDINDDYISLRRLNRHLAIVVDSDKTKASARLSNTKLRIKQRFNDGDGFAWISHGYTVENYVPADLMRAAISAAHKNATSTWKGDRYVNPLEASQFRGTPKKLDKITISQKAVALWDGNTDWIGDLKKQVEKTVAFIRTANGIES
jgi:hypothetical protein